MSHLPEVLEQSKVLITVKTYPLPSNKYKELVCTAGVLEELVAIKKLLAMALYAAGVPSEEIDKAAKMGAANIRALSSKKKAKITVRLAKEKEDT